MLDLVGEVGAEKKSTARFLALGVNGLAVALMVLVFSQTGGLTGAEVGIAGGSALLAQRLLEAVFGEDAVRRLARTAKERLDERVQTLMATELGRYHRALDGLRFEQRLSGQLRMSAERLSGMVISKQIEYDEPRQIEPPDHLEVADGQ